MCSLRDVTFVALRVGHFDFRVEFVRVVFHELVDVRIVGPRDAFRIEENDDSAFLVEGDIDRRYVAVDGWSAKDVIFRVRCKQITVVVHFLVFSPLPAPTFPVFPGFSDGSIAL